MNDLGSLSECLVDNDPAARVRARLLRSKALAFSATLEAMLLTSMFLWPLISPAALPQNSLYTPIAPYYGGGKYNNPGESRGSAHPGPTKFAPNESRPTWQPHEIPRTPTDGNAEQEDDFDCGLGEAGPNLPGITVGGPGALGIEGGTGDRVLVPEPPHAEPVHVRPTPRSGEVMAAMLVNRVEPKYPTIAIAAHISGTVHLRAIISKDGTVRELEVVDGNPLLAQAALVAVRNWRYQPTRLNGEPVEVETYVTVNFILN
jgi:periplasmic protein TonB